MLAVRPLMRRVAFATTLITIGAMCAFAIKCAAAVRKSRAITRAARLAARARKMGEDELLADPSVLAELKALLDAWPTDFLSARVAADALCRVSRPGRVKDALHRLGVTQTLESAIMRFAEPDLRPNAAREYRGRLLRFDGAQAAPPGQLPGQLPFAPRPFALVQDVFLALASSLSDGGGHTRLGDDEEPEPEWAARQDGLLGAVPALLKLATQGPVVVCVAHPHAAQQQPPAARARQNVRIWMELEHTPDPRALVTCVNIAQGQGLGNRELQRRDAASSFSALASVRRWRGPLQRVWTRKDQAFLRMVAGMGLGFVAGPRVGRTPPVSGWRASPPLVESRKQRVRKLRVESAVMDRLVCELVGAVKLPAIQPGTTPEAAAEVEDGVACGVHELVHAVALLTMERRNRRAFARATAAPLPESEPLLNADGEPQPAQPNPLQADAENDDADQAVDGGVDAQGEEAEEEEEEGEETDEEATDGEDGGDDDGHGESEEEASPLPAVAAVTAAAAAEEPPAPGAGIGALLRICARPSRPRHGASTRRAGFAAPALPYPPAHCLAATALWRLAIDARCRPALEVQLAVQKLSWNLAPVAGRGSASAEPIPWACERVVWIGWSGGDLVGPPGRSGGWKRGEVEGQTVLQAPCCFNLLSQELMRCVVRQLRPIGLCTEYFVLPAQRAA